jgi:hypothetical protein
MAVDGALVVGLVWWTIAYLAMRFAFERGALRQRAFTPAFWLSAISYMVYVFALATLTGLRSAEASDPSAQEVTAALVAAILAMAVLWRLRATQAREEPPHGTSEG